LKVSKQSNVKTVAGSISHTSRAGESPTCIATGKESVNQAVKSIAIARSYLEEDKLDISCYPEFRDEDKDAISFVLTKTALRPVKAPVDESAELRVAATSEPATVAGSIAGKIRGGDRVSIISLGPGSVNQTVKSIIVARRYLARDAIDICFRPEFVHLNMQDGERSAIRFVLLAQQI
jgi:stage V sporulation protein S